MASEAQASAPAVSATNEAEDVHDTESFEVMTLPCAICQEDVLCTGRESRQMMIHLEEAHQQLVCPVCCQMFDKNIAGIDSYFHCHVENHFNTPRYPQPH